MDRDMAIEITIWAANEYAYIRRTGFKPSNRTPYSDTDIDEAVLTLSAPDSGFAIAISRRRKQEEPARLKMEAAWVGLPGPLSDADYADLAANLTNEGDGMAPTGQELTSRPYLARRPMRPRSSY